MSEANEKRRVSRPRLSLTKKQLQTTLGTELLALCQRITADGRLTKDEVIEIGRWLRENKAADLPGVAYLSELYERVVEDGRVSSSEQQDFLEAIELVLPSEARRAAKSARKEAEAAKKAKKEAAERKRERLELEREERRTPDDEFDFMVAGVHAEGRGLIVEKYVQPGDRVRLIPEPDNPFDEDAVIVALMDGQIIGYVPRTDSTDVSMTIGDGGYYVASVKKLLTRGSPIRPVVVVQFYRQDQIGDIGDLCPTPSPQVPSSLTDPVSVYARSNRSTDNAAALVWFLLLGLAIIGIAIFVCSGLLSR